MSNKDYINIIWDNVLEKHVVEIILDYKKEMEDLINKVFYNKLNWNLYQEYLNIENIKCQICLVEKDRCNYLFYILQNEIVEDNLLLCQECRNLLDINY
jgi:hypothetical protein